MCVKRYSGMITEEEKELIIDELHKRMMDMIYMNGRERVTEKLEPHWSHLDLCDTRQTITFSYSIEMVTGDIIQVLGRKRREGNKKLWSLQDAAFGTHIKEAYNTVKAA